MRLLGAITEGGERLCSRFEEYVGADHAEHIISPICKDFENNSVVVLDGTPCFRAPPAADLTARDDLAFVTSPAYSSEFNPDEECWWQRQDARSDRFFDSLDELSLAIDTLFISHHFQK